MRNGEAVYLNGRIIGHREAAVSPLDRGFLYGDGFFETTRIMGGVPLLLDRHLRRLAASCRDTGFGTSPDPEALTGGVDRLIAANDVKEGYLRITVSRGLHAGRLTDLETAEATVFAVARPMELAPLDSPPPITLLRSPYVRNENSPTVGHKTLSYQANLLALAEARAVGADEACFLNSAGELAEGAITNLFFVSGGAVCTPAASCGLLPGITREVVLELCDQMGVPTETGRYEAARLLEAEEVFCTNSLRGVVSVEAIAGERHQGEFGEEVTARIRRAYADYARRQCGLQ